MSSNSTSEDVISALCINEALTDDELHSILAKVDSEKDKETFGLVCNKVAGYCLNLEALDIGCCEEVTDTAFHHISNEEPCLSLKILKVSNCPKITVVGIGILVGKCSYLEYLDVRSCPHISPGDVSIHVQHVSWSITVMIGVECIVS
ncbi:putative leucine-rich repeat domain, L domain-containing protein [Medicago truncatula]|uniref:Leucine-rich repeat, cysteine-containing n=1 Tax=Medicago truncatula TaxID=3880 RepID=Q2HS50_MEDTR|nr:Leucine-rich repeat, cysteine-containing [Medicago truncatula]AES77429.1 RNI superfamily protein [Medicago truncatula]RHN44245.1 putative leucine-rich repeat domain, L domain-containing protein [Medicago truncatula]